MAISFEKVCRTCMVESISLISIWSSLEPPSLAEMLSALTASNVSLEDKLPEKMCLNCISEMNQAFAFKQKCERSERTLRLYLHQINYETRQIAVQKPNVNPLQYHVETGDGEVFESEYSTIQQNECQIQDSTLQPDIYHCTNCSSEFNTMLEIERHLCKLSDENLVDNSAEDQTESSPQSLSEKKTTENIIMDFIAENTLNFICSRCKASFSSRRSFSLHFNSRKCLQNSYECDICSKIFIKKRYLVRHLQRMHKMSNELHTEKNTRNTQSKSNKRNFKCHLCPKAFTMTSSLKDHLRIHTGERPYLCSTCGKGFTQNSNLKQHLMRHNQNKPYECTKCAAKFVSKAELASHHRTHSGDHPYTCDVCKTGFTTSSSLVKHRRIHSGERPYQCDLCPLRFIALGTMKNHRRTHTGEKPFQCGVCRKSFSQRTDCISHLRTHTDHERYKCKHCESTFAHSASLKTHIKKQHSKQIEKNIV